MPENYKKVSDENLQTLIDGLDEYRSKGVIDPWVLEDGTLIEPLDVLRELQDLREMIAYAETAP